MRTKWLAIILVSLLVLAGCGGDDPDPTQTPPTATVETPTVYPYSGELRGAVLNPPRPIDNFTFTASVDDTFTLSDHQGEIILIYFGYRACPDFCPTTFAELRLVYEALEEPADQLKIIFVTVDPERDTLDMLGPYTQYFHDDFIALREEGDPLQQLMDQFGVVAEKQVVGESALSYLIDHTASLFLIGPDGKLQVQYLYGTDRRDIIHDLQLILDSM